MKKTSLFFMAFGLSLGLMHFAYAEEVPSIEAGILTIEKYGNLTLDIHGNVMNELGYEYGDIVTVDVAGQSIDMPVGSNYSDVDNGNYICRMVTADNVDESYVILAINMGDMASTLGIASKEEIEEDPGFSWTFNEGYDETLPVGISMKEKGGYADEYMMHQLVRSNERSDYPDLSDEEYANFRNIATTGMGANMLYRSSSPVNPELNRNKEADTAASGYGIRTVMNLADSQETMQGYEDYGYSYYSGCNVIPLNLGVDFMAEDFKAGLAKGLRFLAENDGPYLVHCTEGKDRAGFSSALLECLMGASADEVIQDYMITYYNYYGVAPGDERYEVIANSNICKSLAAAFGVEDIREADLASAAEEYLLGIGLTEEEIGTLKEKLGTDAE